MPIAPLKSFLFILLLGISISITCAHAQQPAPPAGENADSLVRQGVAKGARGDLNGAIANFNQAIKIDPKFAPAYQRRGFALMLQNNLDAAISDDNQALLLDPQNADTYYNRGIARAQKGDFDGAIADFNQVLALKPQSPPAYYNRGHVRYFKGDMDGASSDLNQTIAMAPTYAPAYFMRGLVRHAQGNQADATSDFQTCADHGFYYGAFWLWILEMEASNRGIAQLTLANYAAKPGFFQNDDWAPLLASFLLGKITQNQLMTKTQSLGQTNDRLAKAWYYSGMAEYFSGNLKMAQNCFQKSIATRANGSEEVSEAQRELAKLQTIGP